MDIKDIEFLQRIQATFRIEAEEHLNAFSAGLVQLEKAPISESAPALIESMFREIHSLKGAARSVGNKEIEMVCHPLETIFAGLKKNQVGLTKVSFDLFFKTMELISKIIASAEMKASHEDREKVRDLVLRLKNAGPDFLDNGEISAGHAAETEHDDTQQASLQAQVASPVSDKMIKKTFSEIVRIPVSKLDPLLLQAEEFLQVKISVNQQINELKVIHEEILEWKATSRKWKSRRTKVSLPQWNEWLEATEFRLNNLENHLNTVTHYLEKDHHEFDLLVNDHLDSMKQLLMLPVSSLVEAFPAMVREISMDQQKDIEFVVQGSELEIDKRVLEELKGPLIHLIRNSIDHGIGTSQERMMHNKPPRGTISLVFSAKENGLFEITVSDDGKGIDVEKVLKAAVKSGIVQDDSVMDLNQDEILSLIFHSGLSTSSIITDLSGRGLGLSIVQEKVENLNGRLSMETKEGAGTTFHLILPLTLATFRGIMISLGDHFFIMPTLNVECVQRIEYKQIATIENRDTIRIGDNILALVSMAEVLGLPQPVQTRRGTPPKGVPVSSQIKVVVLVSGQTRIAFNVDEVVEEQQVLVKGLGKLLKRVRNISGATILGSGKIVPVIHVADLMKSAARGIGLQKPEIKEDAPIRNTGRILVAEDSITSRTLLKNILETAGYQVVTAIDGAAAYTRARSEEFDLILSDVDMPRMNGFELTVKVKSDTRLRDIPVVLVTSLESRDDKERGIEAGADAYIVKSSFDQGNLLEVIRKLI